ncbi:MAG: DUF3558 family protein [Candidatus Dormibacteria bacterium]
MNFVKLRPAARCSGLSACIFAIALSGCGSTPNSTQGVASQPTAPAPTGTAAAGTVPAAKTALDVCALITEQEASVALGGTTGPGTPRGSGEDKGCEYTRAGSGYVQVGTHLGETRAEFDSEKSKITSATDSPGSTVIEVAGLGDGNFVSSSAHGGGCYVLKGSTLGHITLISPTAMATPAETMKSLCTVMGGRL